MYKCPHCPREFNTPQSLGGHVSANHHGQRAVNVTPPNDNNNVDGMYKESKIEMSLHKILYFNN